MDWLSQLFAQAPAASGAVIPPLGESLAGPPKLGSGDPSMDPMMAYASANPNVGGAMMNALRGVQAMRPPAAPDVGTPGAPRPTSRIESGELLQLMMLLNPPKKDQQALTMARALGGR